MIKRTPQFITSNLCVTVEAVEFNIGEGSQHTNGVEELHLVPVNVYSSFIKTPCCPIMFSHVMKLIWIILKQLKY